MEDLIILIQSSLSDDLLKPKYLKQKKRNKYFGHCYVATETLYHLLDENDKKIYRPAILKINNDTHWFLENKVTGEIIDPTKNQFDFKLNYKNSTNKFFLTKTPSKRALTLINRIYEKIGY